MIVASAALVAVLLGAVWVTPVVKLHYHAWQYRRDIFKTEGTGRHLKKAAELLRTRRASPEAARRLLGAPGREERARDGALSLHYCRLHRPLSVRRGEPYVKLVFRDGVLTSVEDYEEHRLPSVQPPPRGFQIPLPIPKGE